MSRNTTRGALVEMVRDETRSSSNTSRSLDHLAYIQRLIARHNETITDEYAWPYMNIDKASARKTLAAGQRYYDFPTTLNTEAITTVWYQETLSTQWIPLRFGIGPQEYSGQDSDNNDRSDVVTNWDFVTDSNGDYQFEVWPMPASNGGLIWFEGRRKFSPMTDDNDRADHDDQLIALRCASEILVAKNKKDSDIKAAMAGERFRILKSRNSGKKEVSVGGGGFITRTKRTRVLVALSEAGA